MESSFVVATSFDAANGLLNAVLRSGLARKVVTTREELAALRGETILLLAWPYLLSAPFLKRQARVVNVHNSLLPKYRGRHTLTWAIIHGEEESGYSLHDVDAGVDSGPVYAQMRFPIHEDDDINKAFARGFRGLKDWLPQQLSRLAAGDLVAVPQDESRASRFRARHPEDGLICWTQTARQIHNFLRALAPPYTPAAFMPFLVRNGEPWRVEGKGIVSDLGVERLGQVLDVDKSRNAAVIACADGAVRVHFIGRTGPRHDKSFRAGVCVM